MPTTAARQSNVRMPFLVSRSTSTASRARKASTASDAAADRHPGQRDLPRPRLEPVGERAGGRDHRIDDVEPGRQCLVEGGPHLLGVALAGHADLEVLSLASSPRSARRWRTRSAGGG